MITEADLLFYCHKIHNSYEKVLLDLKLLFNT
jgi:hypothetical protein